MCGASTQRTAGHRRPAAANTKRLSPAGVPRTHLLLGCFQLAPQPLRLQCGLVRNSTMPLLRGQVLQPQHLRAAGRGRGPGLGCQLPTAQDRVCTRNLTLCRPGRALLTPAK